jgi:DNA-binding response OmpR family regulator
MKHALLLEPDRVIAKCIVTELSKFDVAVKVAQNADSAITLSDKQKPDVVISELSIPGHSGSEFLYEFRTYSDWMNVPIIVFSSLKPSKIITNSRDWKLLDIHTFLYKPDTTLQQLSSVVTSLDTA